MSGITSSFSDAGMGIGTFLDAILFIGQSRKSMYFSDTIAPISEPMPPLRYVSSTIASLDVFLTEAAIVSISSGTRVRGSITSALIEY